MTGYKVFTASSTDYVLDPAKYASDLPYDKVTARYEIRASCDWIGALHDAKPQDTGGQSFTLSCEDMRASLKDFYASTHTNCLHFLHENLLLRHVCFSLLLLETLIFFWFFLFDISGFCFVLLNGKRIFYILF